MLPPSGTKVFVFMLMLWFSRPRGGAFRKHESTTNYGCCVKSLCRKQPIFIA